MHYTNILLSCPTLSALEMDMVSGSRAQLHFYPKKLILVIFICFSDRYPSLSYLNKDPYHDIASFYYVTSIIMIFPPLPLCRNQAPYSEEILEHRPNPKFDGQELHKHTHPRQVHNLAVA